MVYGKRDYYFASDRNSFFGFFAALQANISTWTDRPFKLITTSSVNAEAGWPEAPIESIGAQSPDDWFTELGRNKVLIGIGSPPLSPTPYDALCLGVPFINPIVSWSPDEPEDRTRWVSQHDGLVDLDPPYVYHVRAGDAEGLGQAVREAIERPIERYVPPRMRTAEMRNRAQGLVQKDWRGMGREVVRRNYGEGEYPYSI